MAFDVILVLALAVELYISNNVLTVSRYQIDADFENPIRIVQLTDLHNKQFGKDNRRLVAKVQELDPDYIFTTGDMISQHDKLDHLTLLIRNLTEIAPVYYSYGNHEKDWEKNYPDQSLRAQLKDAGAIVLDNEYIDTELSGSPIRLGGYYGYYRRPVMTTSDSDEKEKINRWCQEFEDTDRYKILLCHIPTTWLDGNHIDGYPEDIQRSVFYDGNTIELVFSGHYHGGQVRIPGIGGLYAPYVKWFPKFTKGIFEGAQTTCVLSSGLASRGRIPRVFNLPEIVCLEIQGKNTGIA